MPQCWGDAAHHLGNRAGGIVRVSRIFAFGRKGQEVIFSHLQPRPCEQRQQYFVGRARVRGALQHHQLPAMEMLGDHLGRVDDEGQVGHASLAQGSRHANDRGIAVAQGRKISGWPQAAAFNQARDSFGGNVADVAASGPQLLNLGPVNVEAESFKAHFGEAAGQRQPRVTQTQDPDSGAAIVKLRDSTFPQTRHQFLSYQPSNPGAANNLAASQKTEWIGSPFTLKADRGNICML